MVWLQRSFPKAPFMRFSNLPPALRCVTGAILTGLVITGLAFTPWSPVGDGIGLVFQRLWAAVCGVAGFGGSHPLIAFWIFAIPALVCACWLLNGTWIGKHRANLMSRWGLVIFAAFFIFSVFGFLGQGTESRNSRDITFGFGQSLARQEGKGKTPYAEFLARLDSFGNSGATSEIENLIPPCDGDPHYCAHERARSGWNAFFTRDGNVHTVGIHALKNRGICTALVQKEVEGLGVSVNGITPAGKTRFNETEAQEACTSYWDNDVRYFAQLRLDARPDTPEPARP